MHRKVKLGKFTGFGQAVGGDVAHFAREHAYVVAAAERVARSPMEWDFRAGETTWTVRITAGRRLRWTLSRGDQVLATHTFDTLYVDFDVALYPAPNGQQAVLVMHLDTGWRVDAALFPVRLSSRSRPRQP